ncbi:MAG: hypothetical protein PVI90_11780, partial [Desulfobacteraceae bacterium]
FTVQACTREMLQTFAKPLDPNGLTLTAADIASIDTDNPTPMAFLINSAGSGMPNIGIGILNCWQVEFAKATIITEDNTEHIYMLDGDTFRKQMTEEEAKTYLLEQLNNLDPTLQEAIHILLD